MAAASSFRPLGLQTPAVSVLWLLLQFLVNTFPLTLQSPRSSDIGKVHFYYYHSEIMIRDYSALTETVLFLDFWYFWYLEYTNWRSKSPWQTLAQELSQSLLVFCALITICSWQAGPSCQDLCVFRPWLRNGGSLENEECFRKNAVKA